jgi:chromate transporter
MTNQEFLTGFGLVQGLTGPMFSFSAYAGGMAARGGGVLTQVLGAAAGELRYFYLAFFWSTLCIRYGKA